MTCESIRKGESAPRYRKVTGKLQDKSVFYIPGSQRLYAAPEKLHHLPNLLALTGTWVGKRAVYEWV
jgi:hypothetical protein